MAINNITTDYTGRTKDINVFYKPDPTKTGVIQPMSLVFGNISSFVAGPQKLIQRYALALLTELGSQALDTGFGTDMLTRLHNSAGLGKIDVTYIFAVANSKVVQEFRTYQNANPSTFLDEQLDTASLTNLDLNGDSVRFYITLNTMAGTSVDYLLPIPKQI